MQAYLIDEVRRRKETMSKTPLEPTVMKLLDLVNYQAGAVVSREVLRTKTGTITLFAFDEAQGLSEHTAPFDAVANVLEGDLEITISGSPLRVRTGEVLIMPAGEPHALKAIAKSKMLLIMIRS
jgi:quercetin dioxygenase-like cupin family protein